MRPICRVGWSGAAGHVTVRSLDWRLVAFAVALAGGCAILFALAPAMRSTRITLTAGLEEAARRGAPVGADRPVPRAV